MAGQVYAENGKDDYRVLSYLPCGAPVLEGEHSRISLTHTDHLMAVATLPPTPEIDLRQFNQRSALGIDAEKLDREQVLKVRPRFLADEELAMIPETDLRANLLAWTAKEAVWKAMLTPGLDFQKAIVIKRLPIPGQESGEAMVHTAHGDTLTYNLYSFIYSGYLITLALTPATATYRKQRKSK